MNASERTTSRRGFLATGGATAALGMVLGSTASAESATGPSELEKANEKVVNDFCAAFDTLDQEKLLSFLSDDITFRMFDTAPLIEGKEAMREGLASFLAPAKSAHFEMIRSQAMGNIVLNERIDHFDMGEVKNTFHMTGVFLVKSGKIVEWYDYSMPK